MGDPDVIHSHSSDRLWDLGQWMPMAPTPTITPEVEYNVKPPSGRLLVAGDVGADQECPLALRSDSQLLSPNNKRGERGLDLVLLTNPWRELGKLTASHTR